MRLCGRRGLYDWVKLAHGHTWASRVAWNYWINVALWIASLAVLFNDVLIQISGWSIPLVAQVAIQLAFIWIVVLLSKTKISESTWLINTAAVFKVIVMLLIGFLGIYVAVTRGPTTEFTVQSLLPSFDPYSLSFISIIAYNFVGFEIVTTLADDMDKPQKQIPQALLLGGAAIALFYMFASFGVGVGIPADQISSDSGLLDSVMQLSGSHALLVVVGLMAMFTFVANLVSWSYGSLYVAKYAADEDDMPRLFAAADAQGNPTKSNILNGVIASVMVIVVPFLPDQNAFWNFFSVGVFTLMIAYIPMFTAFVKLRRVDADHPRPFRAPFEGVMVKVAAMVPLVIVLITLVFTVVPLNTSAEELDAKLPLLAGVVVSLVIQEVIVAHGKRARARAAGQRA